MRLRLDLAYDGTDFCGWALQPGRRSVQGCVEGALATVARTDQVRLIVAGRTDAGVHATGQVAHVDLDAEASAQLGELDRLTRRLNSVLPPDIRIRRITLAPSGFDARFSALSRSYQYRICDGFADPLQRRTTLFHRVRLDVDRLNRASAPLLGLADFASFARPSPTGTTIRTLLRFDWSRQDDVVIATVEADAFCHSMVRSLVGGLLPVGDGRAELDDPARILAERRRGPAVTVAPAHPLCLMTVQYPPDDQLAARAAKTRAPRTAPDQSGVLGSSGEGE